MHLCQQVERYARAKLTFYALLLAGQGAFINGSSHQYRELRDLYRQMHITAKAGRQIAQELVKAALVTEIRLDGAEAYAPIEPISR